MKQVFISRKQTPQLTLFFAGWGMDENPFLQSKGENDLMICYDYREQQWDTSALESYRSIHVVAWSMGVWAAERALENSSLPIAKKTAINGTPFPVDNERGIPENIALGTLQQLNERNLQKFFRRMCGSKERFEAFATALPQRTLDDISEELSCIIERCKSETESNFRWDEAYIGTDDLIFPPANQFHAWQSISVKTTQVAQPHWAQELFQSTFFK